MEKNLLQANAQSLVDCEGEHHELDISPGYLIMIDGQPCTLELDEQTKDIRFFGNQCSVRCTAKALWYALAGEQARPTAQEAGVFIAEGLLLSERLRQWRQVLENSSRQTLSLLEQELPKLPLPHARLDPFTEELLARCPDRVSPEQLHTLVCVLGRSASDIHTWLENRGKLVAWLACTEPPETAAQEALGSFQKTKDVPAQEAVPRSTAETEQELPAKRPTFRWTAETIAQLKAAYRQQSHQSDRTVDEQAQAIASLYDWPWQSVRYKIFQLHLTTTEQQANEQGTIALTPGAFLWDVKVDGALQRWALDYPYGHCAFEPGTLCIYRDQTYQLEHVNNSQLVVTRVESPDQPLQPDVQEPSLMEAIRASA